MSSKPPGLPETAVAHRTSTERGTNQQESRMQRALGCFWELHLANARWPQSARASIGPGLLHQ